jgi:hypothetical protein
MLELFYFFFNVIKFVISLPKKTLSVVINFIRQYFYTLVIETLLLLVVTIAIYGFYIIKILVSQNEILTIRLDNNERATSLLQEENVDLKKIAFKPVDIKFNAEKLKEAKNTTVRAINNICAVNIVPFVGSVQLNYNLDDKGIITDKNKSLTLTLFVMRDKTYSGIDIMTQHERDIDKSIVIFNNHNEKDLYDFIKKIMVSQNGILFSRLDVIKYPKLFYLLTTFESTKNFDKGLIFITKTKDAVLNHYVYNLFIFLDKNNINAMCKDTPFKQFIKHKISALDQVAIHTY